MKATCTACDRPVGLYSRQCPYCGESIPEPSWRRWTCATLAGVIPLLLGAALLHARHTWSAFQQEARQVLHDPAAAVVLAIALALTLLPCVKCPARPGAASAAAGRETVADLANVLFFGMDLLLCALLMSRPALSAWAIPALIALLFYPRIMRVPAYPLLAMPLVVLAWRIGIG